MPEKRFALSKLPSSAPAEGAYDGIHAAVIESAPGRWFLEEYARRNRSADTQLVLAAIERIEAALRGNRDREVYQSLRNHLLELARTIAQTRAETTASK